ncbi:lantibiotic dehydratase [Clostridium felsineum]|uniref:lantibiotic dehydratase n=1 Tax=Clostridium felsineum TaxID=36839 RepID=UPI00214D68C9|nr:lantibiotic dehydratase [Clostridium felsineum]MCR3758630.1 lantibiotic dehydratase [Clostridium felsineum]
MNSKYIANNYYMVRSPLQATNFSDKYDNIEKSLEKIKEDKAFNEQLLISSPNLYNMLHETDINKLSNKKKKNLVFSLLSYQNRASFRTTPFGLFSGVELKKIDDKKPLGKNTYIKKHCRIDIEWLILFIKEIEKNNYKLLSYKLNTVYYKFGDRVYLPYNTGVDYKNISIVYGRPFQMIEQVCEKGLVSYSYIINILKENFPDRDIETFNKYLNTLIEKEFLISDLRPSLCNTNELEYVINTLKNHKILEYAYKLEEISDLIKEYENSDLGNGIDTYKYLCKKLKDIFNHGKKSFLQVDCEYINLKYNIDKENLLVINKFINYTFSILSLECPRKDLKDYEIKFVEKYGEYVEVPIYEVINESTGIGAPISYKNPQNNFIQSNKIADFNEKLKKYFLEKYFEAVKTNSYIQLDDSDLTFLEVDGNDNFDDFPNSFELNFIPKIKDGKKVLYLGPNVGSTMAKKTFGRFGYFSSDYLKAINDMSDLITNKNEARCELSFIPSSIRYGNVIRNISNYIYNICCYTNSYNQEKEIQFKNILIGYSNGKFYLRDSKSRKKIKIFMTNMLNSTILPNILRLLIDISSDSNLMMRQVPWKKYYNNFIYIPEIRYKNIIISSEKWKISNYGLKLKDKNSYNEFSKNFMQLKTELSIPDKVYYEVSDNRLLLNLNEEKYLKLLFYYFKKHNFIELEKMDDGEFVNFNNGFYNTEVVIPFIKNNKNQNVSFTSNNDKNLIKPNTRNQKIYLPFENWLYFKLYGPLDRQNELLEYLDYFIKSSKYIDKFYFMRYADPNPHIRIRFKGDKNILHNIVEEINLLLRDLKKKNIIYKSVIDTYIPEIERYGGRTLMEYAENIFFEDSKIVMEIISNIDIDEEKVKYGVISVLQYLSTFNLNFEEQFKYLKKFFNPNNYLEDFRRVRNEYIKDCDSYNKWENLKKIDKYKVFLNLLGKRKKSVFNYCNKFSKCQKHTNSYDDIIASIIHLHCNRLFGIDRDIEKKILNYSCRVLNGQKYIVNHFNDNSGNINKEKHV